nr:hypothetical protein [Elizabethkingia sp. ASV34]
MQKKYTISLILTGVFLSYFNSCSSRDNVDITDTQAKAVLTINPGIIEENLIPPNATVKTNTKASLSAGIIVENKIFHGNDFDALINMEQISKTATSASIAAVSSTNHIAENPRMDIGISYTLRIFADNAGVRGSQVGSDYTFTVGQVNPTITLDGGKTYQWYAFSANETTVPLTMIDAGKSAIDAQNASNKDILYASGSINTQTGNNYLDINFKHMTSRIDVNLDSKGMFTPMSGNDDATANIGTGNGTSFSSIVKTQAFNLDSGTFYGSIVPVSDKALNSSIYTSKVVNFYSSQPMITSAGVLTVKLTNMEFRELNNGLTKFNRSSYVNLPNSQALKTKIGSSYAVNVHLIQSAVNINGILWSRSLLINYNVSWASNVGVTGLRLDTFSYLNPANIDPKRNYWSWNALTPEGTPNNSNYSATQDPCMQLYPAGAWRMPTATEASSLVAKTPDNLRIAWSNPPTIIYSDFGITFNHTAGATATEYITEKREMYIPFAGYRPIDYPLNENLPYPNSILEWQRNATSSGSTIYTDGIGMFWTSDVGAAAGTAKAFARNVVYSNNGSTNTASFPPGSIKDVDKRTGLNVRCVRTNSIPNM